MNIQILSNSINKAGNVNKINDFFMQLNEPIDGESQERTIIPLCVTYPLSTVNITKDQFWFSVKITFSQFISKHINFSADTHNIRDCQLDFESDKIIIPDGIYGCKSLVDYINNWLEQYDIYLEYLENGKTAFHLPTSFQYWFKQKSNTLSNSFNGGAINYLQQGNVPSFGTMQITLLLSSKLNYLLGSFSNLGPFFSNDIKSKKETKRTVSNHNITSKYVADSSVGVNRMFIYCDEVQKSIVGNSKSSLLCSVPLKISDTGSAELETYKPPYIKRKLNRSIIHGFNVQVKDNEGKLVPFDSGSISIECLVI